MSEGQEINIADDGQVLRLNFSGLLEYHGGGAVFGAAVGFRALQAAGRILSRDQTWDRKNLQVFTGHPGPGVRDAIEYVTRVVTRGGFQPPAETQCNSSMKFVWKMDEGKSSVILRLRDGFLPPRFFELLDRIQSDKDTPDARKEFAALKLQLSRSIWDQPLDELFEINYVENLSHA